MVKTHILIILSCVELSWRERGVGLAQTLIHICFYSVGECGINKNQPSRSFCDELITPIPQTRSLAPIPDQTQESRKNIWWSYQEGWKMGLWIIGPTAACYEYDSILGCRSLNSISTNGR